MRMHEGCARVSRESTVARECDRAIGFDNPLWIAVTAFLQHPTIAIRVREVSEARVVLARGVEPHRETSVPGIDRYFVPDCADRNPMMEQAAPRSLKVSDDEID